MGFYFEGNDELLEGFKYGNMEFSGLRGIVVLVEVVGVSSNGGSVVLKYDRVFIGSFNR